jgi:hypothetical protein
LNVIVIGAGYVGLANGAVLAEAHAVTLIDTNKKRVDDINSVKCPFYDPELETRLKELNAKGRKLRAQNTLNPEAAKSAELIIIAVPTNYSDEICGFDTSAVDTVAEEAMRMAPQATIVIKSTVPIGYTNALVKRLGTSHIIVSPEFLKEGAAYRDCKECSRTVIGALSEIDAQRYQTAIFEATKNMDGLRGPFLLCSPAEAEAIKLFSNAYLAMRVAFFNELDTCADMKGLDSERIIRGLGLDARIGDYYNNPSFGYGGYCLPKDTKQLESSCGDIPQELVSAIVKSNETRKRYLVDKIKGMEPTRVGVYRLAMKRDSDNCRNSSIGDVAACLGDSGISILVFEPLLMEDNFKGFEVTRDLGRLFDECDLIIANRVTRDLRQYSGTIVTRDVFNRD